MLRTLLTTCALLGAALPATAQDSAAPAEYAVEILVFAHADRSGTTMETGGLERSDAASGAGTGSVPGFRLLPDNQMQLGSELARLRDAGPYRPLLHLAWAQQAPPRDSASPVRLDAFGGYELTGSIQLHKSRHLHLALDVRWIDQLLAAPDSGAANGDAAAPAPLRASARIRESRRMRIGRPRYFDHPLFGVIAMVWRLDESSAAALQPPATRAGAPGRESRSASAASSSVLLDSDHAGIRDATPKSTVM